MIPTYSLHKVASLDNANQGIFFSDTTINNSQTPLNIPYRSDYYGVGICLKGTATLQADLENYRIQPGDVIAMSPQIIKQWVYRSRDYKTLALFFKADFLLSINRQIDFLNQFIFFQKNERHVFKVNRTEEQVIRSAMQSIQSSLSSSHAYRTEIVGHEICILLYKLQGLVQTENFKKAVNQTRSGQLALNFKNLVSLHFKQEHSVKFYAEKLYVTSKHLSEIIKTETGRTAGEWIDETIVLEAKVLLSNPKLTINEIAYQLNFADQSAFGKFFKNLTGLSPKAYKQAL